MKHNLKFYPDGAGMTKKQIFDDLIDMYNIKMSDITDKFAQEYVNMIHDTRDVYLEDRDSWFDMVTEATSDFMDDAGIGSKEDEDDAGIDSQ